MKFAIRSAPNPRPVRHSRVRDSTVRHATVRHARQRSFVYVGWLGFDNYGDDLLLYVWQKALGDELEARAPLQNSDYLGQWVSYLRGVVGVIGHERMILLGGGTALGFENWAAHLRRAQRYYRTRPVLVIGAGAAESTDDYAFDIQPSGWEQWRKIPDLTVWGVRGPITQTELRDGAGFDSMVTGDPALMWPFVNTIDSPEGSQSTALQSTVLGVCVGSHNSTRFDLEKVAAGISAALPTSGCTTITLFQLATGDHKVTAELARLLGPLVGDIHTYTGDVVATTNAIGACRTFVSERLHGAIAAVATGRPTVMLAYASKCDDFWLSVSGERPPVTPASTIEEIRRAVLDAPTDFRRLNIHGNAAALGRSSLEIATRLRSWNVGDPAGVASFGG